jgi:hypothetical protein
MFIYSFTSFLITLYFILYFQLNFVHISCVTCVIRSCHYILLDALTINILGENQAMKIFIFIISSISLLFHILKMHIFITIIKLSRSWATC